MSSAGQLPALVAELTAKTDGFQAGLTRAAKSAEESSKQITDALSKVQGVLGTLGVGVSVAALGAYVKHYSEMADGLGKMSQRVGVSVESLSTLRYAADLAGIGMEDLDSLLTKLNKTLGDAGAGGKDSGALLKQFGISAKEVKDGTIDAEEALKRISDRFATTPDGINKSAAAVELFGKAGAKMIPFLNQGRDAIEDLQKEATKLGLKLSTEAAQQAEAFNDQLRTLEFASEGAKNAILGSMMPALTEITRAMRDATIEGGKFQGFVAGLQTLMTGSDRYKNDKELVQLTEKKLELEGKIARSRGSPAVSFLKAELDSVNARIQTSQAYRAELEKQAAAEEEAARRRDKLKQAGKQLVLPEKGDGGSKRVESDPGGYVSSVFKSSMGDLEKLQKLLAGTPIESTRAFEESVARLNTAFFNGALSVQEYDQAMTLLTGKLPDTEKSLQALREAGQKVFNETRTPLELVNARMEELNRLLEAGVIDWDTYERAGSKALEALADKSDELGKFARDIGLTFSSAFEDAIVKGKAFSDVLKGLAQDLLRIVVRKTVTEPLGNAIAAAIKGGDPAPQGGGKNVVSEFFSGIGKLFGFAEGGSFRVGGSGGVDSQLVAFRASPDETVSITRPGQGLGGGNVEINVINNGPPVSAQASAPRFDGRRMIVDVMIDTLRTNGNARDAVRAAVSPVAG